MKLVSRVAALSTVLLVRVSTYSFVSQDKDLALVGKYSFLRKGSLERQLSAPGKPAQIVNDLERQFKKSAHIVSGGHNEVLYGDVKCPCIGFEGLEGEVSLELESNGQQLAAHYPKEVGASCHAWDLGHHPECSSGSSPEWCGRNWCFVDPCNCQIDVVPAPAVHLQALYKGHPIHYSYATCGPDRKMEEKHPRYGSPGCRCVGFENTPGTLKVKLSGNREADYPFSAGATCKAWDRGNHPDCLGDDAPPWCNVRWCYVDACACKLESGHVPKISSFLPDATFQGKAFYYSYETCGEEDKFTKTFHKQACVNQLTEKDCDGNPRCAWSGKRCLGKELVHHPLCEDLLSKRAKDRYLKSGAAPLAPAGLLMATIAACLAAVVGRVE